MGTTERAKLAVQLSLEGVSKVQKDLAATVKSTGAFWRGLKSANEQISYGVNTLRNVADMAGRVNSAIKEGLQYPITLDNWREELQMTGMTAAEAKAKIKELLDTAGELDQPHEQVVKGFAKLMRSGGEELSGTESLKQISRAAKYAQASFEDMSSSVGLLYNKLKGGKDFSLAARELLRMDLISGETFKSIDDMESGGKIEGLKKKIEDLMAGSTSDIGQGSSLSSEKIDKIKGYEQQIENLKNNSENPFEKLWGTIWSEIKKKTKNVDLADQTFADRDQHLKDQRAYIMAGAMEPILKDKFDMTGNATKQLAGLSGEELQKFTRYVKFLGSFSEMMDDPMMQALRLIAHPDTTSGPRNKLDANGALPGDALNDRITDSHNAAYGTNFLHQKEARAQADAIAQVNRKAAYSQFGISGINFSDMIRTLVQGNEFSPGIVSKMQSGPDGSYPMLKTLDQLNTAIGALKVSIDKMGEKGARF